uniref:CSN8/PSMD8/EIF3K domain-containing protein n=1 Tax=Globodera rostochiensis TaxID=31243 RepID=A0A914H2K9_GLORO
METPKDRCIRLEDKELGIGESLSVEEYSELLLGYLVQQLLIKAKFCYVRASEKFERNQQLTQIWSFGKHMVKQNFDKALRICNATTLGEYSQPYVDELRRRLTAAQLLAVANSYSSIGLSKFAQLVGLDESSAIVHELLQKCHWNVAEDKFISPVKNAELLVAVDSLNDPMFGNGFDVQGTDTNTGVVGPDSNLTGLKSLIDSTMFVDAMTAVRD